METLSDGRTQTESVYHLNQNMNIELFRNAEICKICQPLSCSYISLVIVEAPVFGRSLKKVK